MRIGILSAMATMPSAGGLKNNRAKTTRKPQGHRMIEETFDKEPKTPGVHDVKVSQPSKVYYPDGTTKTTDTVRVVIRDKPIMAYPYVPGD